MLKVYYSSSAVKSISAMYLSDPSHSLADKLYQIIFSKKIGCCDIENDTLAWINKNKLLQITCEPYTNDNNMLNVTFDDCKVLTCTGRKILIKVEDYSGQIEYMLVTPNIISTREDIRVDYANDIFSINLATYNKNHGLCDYFLQPLLPSVIVQQIVLCESNTTI